MYEKKVKELIDLEVNTDIKEKQNEIEFLESLISELEDQLRIELRKKAILKN